MPEWSRRYGYRAPSEYELRPGGAFRPLASDAMKAYGAPDVIIDEVVLEVDPPHQLVQTYRFLWGAELVSGNNPQSGGGWSMILSDLKTLLETGEPLFGSN